ncbi:MAG TPA: hypothetical protein VKR06_46500 [Ktedonosporobacter sp.]|nr:hypothetical protein [Ktedonosporobacter sp.]
MTTTQQKESTRWEGFVSLNWYDGLISFLFRFVSKTAEPLLAVGVIVSAADFLLKGQLMAHNPGLATSWAWTQALAIEASTGPVLVFGLSAFAGKDMIKGWLYAVLAALLFVVGGAMLLLQMGASVTGAVETSVPGFVLWSLFVLRVIVSGGMVALSCTKHMRFSGLFAEQPVAQVSLSDEKMQLILAKLAKLDEMEKTLQATIVTPLQESPTLALPSPDAEILESLSEDGEENRGLPSEQKEGVPNEQSYGDQIEALYKENPKITAVEVEKKIGCSRTTAANWLRRVRPAK